MSGKDTKEKSKEGAEAKESAEMCRQMVSSAMPDCCGSEMRGMMSRMVAEFQAAAKK